MDVQLSFSSKDENVIGRATSVEDIIAALARRGCVDLTSSINFEACSEFPLAGGGLCDVYRGKLQDNTLVAIKSLRVYDCPGPEGSSNSNKIFKHAAKELYHWSKMSHRNVLPLMGLALFRGHISMISEWMDDGNLTRYLARNPGANRIKLCLDVCEGLYYIHENDMVHGDLKAENVMISPNGVAMIADFGSAQLKDLTLKFTGATKPGITVRWAAPELIYDDAKASKASDVYAYGMTALEILSGELPYAGKNERQVLGLLAQGTIPSRPQIGISDDLWSTLTLCWAGKPSKRPTMMNILDRLLSLGLIRSLSQTGRVHSANYPPNKLRSGLNQLLLALRNMTERLELASFSASSVSDGESYSVHSGSLTDGTLVAIKVPIYQGRSEKHLERAARQLWPECRHPNVLELLGWVELRGEIGMVSPWTTYGSVRSYLTQQPNADRHHLCFGISEGLVYLHRIGIVHGNLKGENVLISNRGTPLLAGFSSLARGDQLPHSTYNRPEPGGSPRWAAPEVLNGIVTSSYSADVFSLGMTFLETITGSVPYHEIERDATVYMAIVFKKRIPAQPEAHISSNNESDVKLWSLLTRCWTYAPKYRPNAEQVRDTMLEIVNPENLRTMQDTNRPNSMGTYTTFDPITTPSPVASTIGKTPEQVLASSDQLSTLPPFRFDIPEAEQPRFESYYSELLRTSYTTASTSRAYHKFPMEGRPKLKRRRRDREGPSTSTTWPY